MKAKVWLALIAVYIVWGSTYLAIRFMVESIPPFFSAGMRFLISGLILYLWRRSRGDASPSKQHWKSATLIGLFLLLGGNGSLVWAEQYIDSGIASLFIATTPLWMVLIDSLRPAGNNPGRLTWIGILSGFVGIIVLVAPWQTDLITTRELHPAGVAALLFAALSWSIGSLYSRKASLPASPLMYTGMEMLAGCVGLFAMSGLMGEWGRLDLGAVQARSLWGLAYLISFGSLVGFVSFTWLMRNAPTPLVATYAYVNPLVAILLGVLFAGEILDGRVILSAAIIISAVILINFSNSASRRAAQPAEPPTGDD